MTSTATSPQLPAQSAPAQSPSARLSAAPAGYPAPMYPHRATEEQHREHRIRSFQPRRGRMTPAQAGALDRHWEQWGLAIDGTPLDLPALFGGLPVTLEIGFGMGETTAAMAAADPSTGILAADVHTPGHGNLLGLLEQSGARNVRLAAGDAVILLRDMLGDASLAGLRVYFADPWPKPKHHKRRLVQPHFLDLVLPRLAPGALVHCATDWEPYAEQMLDVLGARPELVNLHPQGDGSAWTQEERRADGTVPGYAPRPEWRPVTKFERAGLAKGHVVHDLLFRKI
ncbi:tRNA (guanosine(46)-N7)-methyltransferase TrmB [Kitasatospora sp. NBC_01287]|uniref:tRNA (guanosine(46)-N7)-methyltransferase TrmB n=1 Tax=Kitasatospora sp. NBC_01287 TaxID=2903573 RepID=UPI002256A62D|nr:tRNA (guanosine(46)-N7)-methyltransferase TrmB [Kitasatospora sp. NBC_01287]MCX4747447.1 tRNA (guanosine(46)-N7)-methyltransferase TrmB [Kitasatospora sp. NBC_01287]